MVGASGAISAIIAAYALLFSEQKVRDIGAIPGTVVRVVWLAAAWSGVQLLIGLAGLGGGPHIALAANIAGFLVGLAIAPPHLLWRDGNNVGYGKGVSVVVTIVALRIITKKNEAKTS